jgi:hypothetical protein
MQAVQFLAWFADTNHLSRLPHGEQFCKPHHALHLEQNVFANFYLQRLKPQPTVEMVHFRLQQLMPLARVRVFVHPTTMCQVAIAPTMLARAQKLNLREHR